MRIDESMIENLMTNINSHPPKKNASNAFLNTDIEHSAHDFGSVWHGDFYNNSNKKFGSKAQPNHFAMVRDQKPRCKSTCTFAPITSQRKSPASALQLSPGVLKVRKQKCSYLLVKYKLIVRKVVLNKSFEYIQRLPEEYITQAKEMMDNV